MVDFSSRLRELTRDAIIEKAFQWYGKPYHLGGNGPENFDCSGLVIAVLQGVHCWPQGLDDTAHGIYNRFKKHEVKSPHKGCLAFYGTTKKIKHVVICINRYAIIGANGRDIRKVSVEPIDYRVKNYNLKDLVAYCDPVMAWGHYRP